MSALQHVAVSVLVFLLIPGILWYLWFYRRQSSSRQDGREIFVEFHSSAVPMGSLITEDGVVETIVLSPEAADLLSQTFQKRGLPLGGTFEITPEHAMEILTILRRNHPQKEESQ